MKDSTTVKAANRKWMLIKNKEEYTLIIKAGSDEILNIGPISANIIKSLKDSGIINK